MIYDITVSGEATAKKNSLRFTRKGVVYHSKATTKWEQGALAEIRRQWKGREPLAKADILFCLYHSGKRRRDADNQVSTVLDLLVKGGVLADDRWEFVSSHYVQNFPKSRKAFCTIFIRTED